MSEVTMNTLIKRMAGVVITLVMVYASPKAFAAGYPAWLGEADCTVSSTQDNVNYPGNIRSAINLFNQADTNLQRCKGKIEIDVSFPLTINTPIVLSGEPGSNGFVFGAKAGKFITIDAHNIKSGCAIKLIGGTTKGNSQYVIQNIILRGVSGNGSDGICIERNGVTLKGVQVKDMKGVGIRIGKTAQGTSIVSSPDLSSGAFSNSGNILIEKLEGSPHFVKADPNLVIFNSKDPSIGELNLEGSKSSDNILICGTTTGKNATVTGQLYDDNGKPIKPSLVLLYSRDPADQAATSTPQPQSNAAATNETPVDVKKVVLSYFSDEDEPLLVGVKKDKFISTSGKFVINFPNVDDKQDFFVVVHLQKGKIEHSSKYFKVGTSGEWGDCDKMKKMSGGSSSGGIPGGAGSFVGDDPINVGSFYGYVSVEHCMADKGIIASTKESQEATPIELDSDGDGLKDYLEDVDGDCQWDQGIETDWLNRDTDGDGITDSIEDPDRDGANCVDASGNPVKIGSQFFIIANKPDIVSAVNPQAFQTNTHILKGCLESMPNVPGGNKTPAIGKTSGFKLKAGFLLKETDPILADTDGDGLMDGEEDRGRGYKLVKNNFVGKDGNPWNGKDSEKFDGVLMTLDGSSRKPFTIGFQNKLIPCNISQLVVSQAKSKVGIGYGAYVVTTTKDSLGNISGFQAVKVNDSLRKMSLEGIEVRHLACTANFIQDSDFNGQLTTNTGETDPRKFDTDDDELFDGGIDKCPNTFKKDNICLPECIDNEAFNYIPKKYVYPSHDGMIVAEDGQYLMFKELSADEIRKNFVDTDKDGIPDIVENPTGQCLNQEYMKAYNPDSDDDGVLDGEDACPLLPGKMDPAGKPTPGNCSKQDTYSGVRAFLSCFIDRDGDGLMDGQEDINLDGQVQVTKGRLTTAVKDICRPDIVHWYGESDPDKKDTDGAGEKAPLGVSLDDKIELMITGTNPSQADTDFDGLTDFEEVNRDTDPFTQPTIKKGLSAGTCNSAGNPAGNSDTDPIVADTDGDGLQDGIEVTLETNPNNADSDGDGLCDGKIAVSSEFGNCKEGEIYTPNKSSIPRFPAGKSLDIPDDLSFISAGLNVGEPNASNPCEQDTDHDSKLDANDANKKNPNLSSQGPDVDGMDSDGDGLPDSVEKAIATNPFIKDSDGDSIPDGCINMGTAEETGELCYTVRNKAWNSPTKATPFNKNFLETNPTKKDTDSDGMSDLAELSYPNGVYVGSYQPGKSLNPNQADTDGDGILDGVEDGGTCTTDFCCGSAGLGRINWSGDGVYQAGLETNALDRDTDKDQLDDGNTYGYIGRGVQGEDLNCNGKIGLDASSQPTEANPRLADSNGDGISDKQAICQNGLCDSSLNAGALYSNLNPGGCSLTVMPGRVDGISLLMFGLPVTVALGMRLRRRKTV